MGRKRGVYASGLLQGVSSSYCEEKLFRKTNLGGGECIISSKQFILCVFSNCMFEFTQISKLVVKKGFPVNAERCASKMKSMRERDFMRLMRRPKKEVVDGLIGLFMQK